MEPIVNIIPPKVNISDSQDQVHVTIYKRIQGLLTSYASKTMPEKKKKMVQLTMDDFGTIRRI